MQNDVTGHGAWSDVKPIETELYMSQVSPVFHSLVSFTRLSQACGRGIPGVWLGNSPSLIAFYGSYYN